MPPARRHKMPGWAAVARNLLRELRLMRLLHERRRKVMDGLIYLIGLIVVVMAILSFFGLR